MKERGGWGGGCGWGECCSNRCDGRGGGGVGGSNRCDGRYGGVVTMGVMEEIGVCGCSNRGNGRDWGGGGSDVGVM